PGARGQGAGAPPLLHQDPLRGGPLAPLAPDGGRALRPEQLLHLPLRPAHHGPRAGPAGLLRHARAALVAMDVCTPVASMRQPRFAFDAAEAGPTASEVEAAFADDVALARVSELTGSNDPGVNRALL